MRVRVDRMANQPIGREIELADLPVDLACRVERHLSPCRLDSFGNHIDVADAAAQLTWQRSTGTRQFLLSEAVHPPEIFQTFHELVHEIARYDA